MTDSTIDTFLADAVELARKHKISVAEVVAAKEVLELERQNNLYVANGDAFDEQIAGLGELLQQISSAIENSNNTD